VRMHRHLRSLAELAPDILRSLRLIVIRQTAFRMPLPTFDGPEVSRRLPGR